MAEKVPQSVQDKLKKSLDKAGQAEIDRDMAAAKRLGLTLEEYKKKQLDDWNRAASRPSRMYPTMKN